MTLPAFSAVVSTFLCDLLFTPEPDKAAFKRRYTILCVAKLLPDPVDLARPEEFPAAVDQVFEAMGPVVACLCRDDGAGFFGDLTHDEVRAALVTLARCRRDVPVVYRAYAAHVVAWPGKDALTRDRAIALEAIIALSKGSESD
jgi:hypothetical protein